MKTGRYRWNIKWFMILVAVLAGLFGLFGVAEGIGVGIALLILLGPPHWPGPAVAWRSSPGYPRWCPRSSR